MRHPHQCRRRRHLKRPLALHKLPRAGALIAAAVLIAVGSPTAAGTEPPDHGVRPDSLVIRNAIVVDGSGKPAYGPATIVVKGDRIDAIQPAGYEVPNASAEWREIDAAGGYVLPGFVNMHAHIHGPWGPNAFPLDYIYKLWLACGITTVRDVGSVGNVTLREREKSARADIVAPHIFAYLWFPGGMIGQELRSAESMTEASLRAEVRTLHERGADGLKLRHFDRETVRTIMDEAHRLGLRTAHHVGVEDMDARDVALFGTTTIEHWYGIPDAALTGSQDFPPGFNYGNELHRFRYAGRLWREADPAKLDGVLAELVAAGVAWDPTFAIYEASRDLQRAVTHPAFEDYLHPAMADYFAPDPTRHGSFFFGWTNTDEVRWRENYRIWMDAVRRFSELGGLVTTGEDAGFIYQLFGFCYLRELQLHEEAGFHPLDVIRHATHNGAVALGQDQQFGRIRPGHRADLVVVRGNPLANLQVLMPPGLHEALDQQGKRGIAWTIKAGIPYRPEILLEDVRKIVAEARELD